MNIVDSYRPSELEEYMNPKQLDYFKAILLKMRHELIVIARAAKEDLKESWLQGPDMFDVATLQTDIALDIGDLDRQREMITEIDRALAKIKSGDYGYCELSGEKIGIKRLVARPVATLCIEVQESMERARKQKQRYAPYGFEEMLCSV